MQANVLFNSILISHSVDDAEKVKAATYDIKHPIEVAEDESTKPKPAEIPKSPMDLKFMDDPMLYVREKVQLFLTIARRDPLEAARFVPEVAGGIALMAVSLIAMIAIAFSTSGATPPPQVKKAAEKAKEAAVSAKDQIVDATATGAEKVQAEVNKRTTRSSGSVE